MGLKNGSSQIVGAKELAYLMAAFEEVNKARITVALTVGQAKGKVDMLIEVLAWPLEGEPPGVKPLGSSKFFLGVQGFRSMEAAILFGLYQIDFALADGEFRGTINN